MIHLFRYDVISSGNDRCYIGFSLIIISIVFSLCISCGDEKPYVIKPQSLTCEYSNCPLGIETINPRLGWILSSSKRNQKQSAYRILVASSNEILNKNIGDLWDSQKVLSDESVHIFYQGKAPVSGMRFWWKVCVWDQDNRKSDWSETGTWEMGLLNPEDWKAQWISYECNSAPLLRKEVDIRNEIKEARIYICGLGYYELHLNGMKIGENVLDPAQTDYEKRTFYVVYDVTGGVRSGANAIGITLGNGWYNQATVNHGRYGWEDVIYGKPRLLFQMHLIYNDGTESLVLSDDTWTGSGSPIISDNIYAGETYDSRLEQEGWDEPGFDDSAWGKAMISEAPGGKLISQKIPPIKKMGTIVPVALTNPKPGVFVYDLGQNFSGWVKLSLSAPSGTEIQMRFSESVYSDGMIDPASTGVYATDVVQTDKYICNGKGLEEWEPLFTYHGFRYVEMTGFPGKPDLENLQGIFVHTAVKETGTFFSSDSMFNQLHKTALWTQKSNLHGIPTDCPHRERCGWLGDAFLTSDMTIYNFDMSLFWSKFIGDIESSRRNGIPTNIVPGRRYGGSDPDWGAAYIQLPWNIYLYYGDKSIITDNYDGLCFFMSHLQSIARDNIIYSGIGSLFSPGRIMAEETPVEYTSTLLYCFCADVMAKMAMVKGEDKDALSYSQLADNIRISFNGKFFNEEDATYGCQEMNTLALAFKMVPSDAEASVAKSLYNYVFDTHKGHITTGIFGSRYIYETLSKYGYSEAVHTMLNNKDFPGFGYLFSLGATTFWENWGEVKFENTLKPADERSRNHPFQGGFDAWFYNGLGGINPDPDNPGFKHIVLKPDIIRTIESCFTQYSSIHGLIKSEWLNTGNSITWKVSVPANTTATAYIPADNKDLISESGVPVTEAEGTEFLRMEKGRTIFELGSGDYEFVITLDQKNIL